VEARVRLGKSGRLVLPAPYRRALGLRPGDELVVELDGDILRLSSVSAAIKRVQAIVSRHVPANRSLADELIAERRTEGS
jgi:AbrB family looped-hinge helix DNA binding protein